MNQGHMAPGDTFATAVEPDTLRLAGDKDPLTLLIPIGDRRKGDLEARIEQRRVDAILAQLGRYCRWHGNASERLILAGPCLGDALEGGPVDQALGRKSTIEVGAIYSLSHARPDRLNRGGRLRSAPRQRHGTGNRDRRQRSSPDVASVQPEAAVLGRQRHLDQWLGAGGNHDRAPDLEGLYLGPLAIAGR